MRWYRFIDICTPLVFSPKVTPDPTHAERLDEKIRQAAQKLNNHSRRDRAGVPATPP